MSGEQAARDFGDWAATWAERLGIPVTVVRARTAREPLHPPIRYIGP